jgi:hypothetical protein
MINFFVVAIRIFFTNYLSFETLSLLLSKPVVAYKLIPNWISNRTKKHKTIPKTTGYPNYFINDPILMEQ